MGYLDAFSKLVEERFGQNLNIEVDIAEKYYQLKIVPLSLQILLENAIKHNVISKLKPLTVKIYVNQDSYLAVENNLQVKNQTGNSTHFGLENIRQRYTFFTDQSVEVITTTQKFIVLLPLVEARHES